MVKDKPASPTLPLNFISALPNQEEKPPAQQDVEPAQSQAPGRKARVSWEQGQSNEEYGKETQNQVSPEEVEGSQGEVVLNVERVQRSCDQVQKNGSQDAKACGEHVQVSQEHIRATGREAHTNGTDEKKIQETPQKITSEVVPQDVSPQLSESTTQEPKLPEEEVPGPEDVLCDTCLDGPRRAVKSCLTCLVSYCEVHLRPHEVSPRFQSHRLVEPLRDVESRACGSHHWPLVLYCCAEARCVCQQCVEGEHRGHRVIPVEEARGLMEKELAEAQAAMSKTLLATESAMKKLQGTNVFLEASVMETRGVVKQQFAELQAAVEKAEKEVIEGLDGKTKQVAKQAEGIRGHLELKCDELHRKQAHAEKLAMNRNDVDFLQEYQQWKKESIDVSLPTISIDLGDRLASFSTKVVRSTQELCSWVLCTYRDKLKDISWSDKKGVKTLSRVKTADPKTRDDFLKYFVSLNFDANTAHKFLRLTEENRKATNTTPWQHSYPDTPQRFEHLRQVLTAQSLYVGRHYFEVDVSGEGAHVGLTNKSIARKGEDGDSCISGNGFSWCLRREARGFSAWHNSAETALKAEAFTRIGVYVDCDTELLAFYGVSDTMTLLHTCKLELQGPLYPAFWLSKKENVVMIVNPGDAPPLKSPSPPSTPPSTATAGAADL